MFSEYPYTNFSDLNLDWIISEMKKYLDAIDDLESWRSTHEQEYQQLKDLYDAVMSGNFPPTITAAFNMWMRENAVSIVGEMVHCVFFGLTDSGYFVAYIPDSWSDIIFSTSGYDDFPADVTEFGHLMLSY